ncbi:cyclic nucleotide-binding domain-containing protein [Sorangium sp. So ce1036]|uniref:cyclic nucleotide-binding domain-containing protein n=1 Tax=Sorangium sp. So ce1036 TaxID=3133328 RepID=UPI003EFC2CDA
MMTPKEFQKQFKRLLMSRVEGMDWEDKLARVRQYLRQLEARQSPEEESAELSPSLELIPFEPGKRPVDEALYPGHGCSERVGCINTAGDPAELGDEVWLLYRLRDLYAFVAPFERPFEVTLSAWFLPASPERGAPCPVPGLIDLPLSPQVVSTSSYPVPMLEPAPWNAFHQTVYVATIAPARQLMPRAPGAAAGGGYDWLDLPASFRAQIPDGEDPFTFASLFRQQLRVEIKLSEAGRTVAAESTEIEVFDTGRFGSLYARLLDRLVKADTESQQRELGIDELHVGYHPWFPVLTIGMDKAALYLRAIHQDLEQHRRNLPDPRWLLRVGLYLELLTCLGIFEAVKREYPDMLSPEEREAFERGEAFAPVRAAIDVAAWRQVWDMRHIAPRAAGFFAAGPVSLTNLMRKQKATLAFLHTHHADLQRAIELAGPNLGNAQETWHRVFRDAERAVLRNSALAFPELSHLDPRWRDFALWHQRGDVRLFGLSLMPEALTGLFGDQDGIFPAACRQYRKSMNDVARWAAERRLMDYTGDECIPRNASLLEATMDKNPSLLAALERRDGYGAAQSIDLDAPSKAALEASPEDVMVLLRRTPVFKPLLDRELRKLARRARRVEYGPLDRIVLQGQRDSSMYVVASGTVEVLVRHPGGQDTPVAALEKGAVFGEFALLTGEERTATVRAIDEVVLYQITKEALQPIIEARPQLVIELSLLMASRQAHLRDAAERYLAAEDKVRSLAGRIRRFVLG